MIAGKLRHRIQAQSLTETQDTFGQPIQSWSTYATVWAAIEPLSGRELEIARQIQADISHKVTLRYLDQLGPKDQFLYGSRVFNVISVLNAEERNLSQTVLCVERV